MPRTAFQSHSLDVQPALPQVTAARVLAHACDQLGQVLDDYHRRVLARLARERRADPF